MKKSWAETHSPALGYGWMVIRYTTLPDVQPQMLEVLLSGLSKQEAQSAARKLWAKGILGVYVRHSSKGTSP